MTLATSYAFGDVFGAHHSLHRTWHEAKFFYGVFTGVVVLAAAIVIIPGAPLGLITTSVQALAGVLLPSATVFLLMLCNDKDVLGPWVNRPWLNVVATVIVSILLAMSLVLMTTTLFSHINVTKLAVALGGVLVAAYIVGGFLYAAVPPAQTARPRHPDGQQGHLAHARPQPARPPPVVARPAGRYVRAARLPGGCRPDAAGQGHPARAALGEQEA